MNPAEADLSYEPFSTEPVYLELNQAFIDGLPIGGTRRVVDLACGTGTLTVMLLERLRRDGGPEGLGIAAIDISRDGLRRAQRTLHDDGVGVGDVLFVEASAAELPIGAESADTVVMGNAIQLLDDKAQLVCEVARVLQPGGLFAFNTSFFAGTFPPGTEHFYLAWVEESVRFIERRNEEMREAGLPEIVRQRGRGRRALSQSWLSADDYTKLLSERGFEVVAVAERTVMLDRACFEAIGAYPGLATVLLSGYPVELACEALVKSVEPALDTAQLATVPRIWLEVTSTGRV